MGESILRTSQGSEDESMVLTFSGHLDTDQLDFDQVEVVRILEVEATTIAANIAEELAILGGAPRVEITFSLGSIDWSGAVVWAHRAWASLDAMARVGGAIGLIQFVGATINRVLRRWIRHTTRPRPFLPQPSTQVIIAAMPRSLAAPTERGPYYRQLSQAALVASVSMLISALAFLISAIGAVVRR